MRAEEQAAQNLAEANSTSAVGCLVYFLSKHTWP